MKKVFSFLTATLITGACPFAQCNEIWNTPDMPLCGPNGMVKLPNNKLLLVSGNDYCQPSQDGSAFTIIDLANGNTLNEYIDTTVTYSLNWIDETNMPADSIVEIIGKGRASNGRMHSLVGKVNTNTLLMDTLFVYPTIDSVGIGHHVFSTTSKKNGKSYYTATVIQIPFVSLKMHICKMDENGIMIWRNIIDETSFYYTLGGYSNTGCVIINNNLIVSYLKGGTGGAGRIYACDSTGNILFTADQNPSASVNDLQNILGIFRNQNNNSFFAVSQVFPSMNGAIRIKEYSFSGTELNSVDIPSSSINPNFKIKNIVEALPLSNGNILLYGDGEPTATEWWKSEIFAMTIDPTLLQETWFQNYPYANPGKSFARDVIVWDTAHFDIVGWFADSIYQYNYLNYGVGIASLNTDAPAQLCYYNDTATHNSIYLFAEKLDLNSEFVVAHQGDRAGFTTNSGSTVIKIGQSVGLGHENIITTEKVNVFPNPTSNNISIVSSENINKVELFDINGKMIIGNLVLQQKTLQMNVSELEPGTYFLRITSDDFVTYKKIIVTH